MKIIAILFFALNVNQCFGLDNGLALTPPMGWMTWERFRCNTDCEAYPDDCISENLLKTQAQMMVSKGFLKAGYEYIIVDDCWLSHKRDSNGELQPDPKRFPSGMKALGDYIHGLGLKFGIYEDYGNFTCGGYPGVLGHLQTDAKTLASWGADYIKLDGCYADLNDMEQGYPEFGKHLNETGRPIVYSCSWPAYWGDKIPNYPAIAKSCNLWRNYGDIQDSYDDVLDIVDHYGDHQDEFAQFAGPGQWNDPDMLIIGDFSLSYDQSQTQMALWSVLAAPLIMSNDLRTIRPEFVEILQNPDVIKINQDPLGHQARRVVHDKKKNIDIFVKQVMPVYHGAKSAAVAIMFRGTATPAKVSLRPGADLGLQHSGGYTTTDVFTGENLGSVLPDHQMDLMVNPNGVRLIRFNVKATEAKLTTESPTEIKVTQDNNTTEAEHQVDVELSGKTGWLGYDDEF